MGKYLLFLKKKKKKKNKKKQTKKQKQNKTKKKTTIKFPKRIFIQLQTCSLDQSILSELISRGESHGSGGEG